MKKKTKKLLGGIISTGLVILFGFPALATYLHERQPVDITGEWKFVFVVHSSSYEPYIGNGKSYKIFLTQHGQELKGEGESWEFDSDLKFESHIPISFEGIVQKYILESRYTLYGAARTTVGNVKMQIDKNGKYMKGKFTGTAADAEGTVEAFKI